ncbi:MAG: DUF2029 domain-containing protein, partial [Sphingomonadaceae bacterium]|nr:DUF2029 domain-containing protein [Sphingomonadaceae bacterium]
MTEGVARRLRAALLVALWTAAGGVGVLMIGLDISRLDGLMVDNRMVPPDLLARLGRIAGGDDVLIGRDFINVWTAGHIVADGRPELLYDVEAYRAYQQALVGHDLDAHNYSYPPLSLPLTAPFGLLAYPLALALWLIGTGVLFVHAARPWMREARLPAILVLLLPASLLNIWTGHYGFIVGALWLYGWRALERAPTRAGVALGLIALKPHLGVLLPIVLALRGQWRSFAAAAAIVLGLILLSLALFGPSLWSDYLSRTTGEQARMIDAGAAFFGAMSTSPATAVLALGAGESVALVAQALIAAVA